MKHPNGWIKVRQGYDDHEYLDPRLIQLSSIACVREETKAHGHFLIVVFTYDNAPKYTMMATGEIKTFEQEIIRAILERNALDWQDPLAADENTGP